MRILTILVVAFSFVLGIDISVFPKAKDGQILQILSLNPMENEENYKIEVEFGKILDVDCNHYFFIGGKLELKNLDGYGYVYYEFNGSDDKNDNMAGTKMACKDAKTMTKFIKFEPKISTNYNSSLPLLIYTPKDIKVRYKVYKLIDERFLSDIKNNKIIEDKATLNDKIKDINLKEFLSLKDDKTVDKNTVPLNQNAPKLIKTH